MILFREDYRKYPDAILDIKTKNESFLILAAKYHKAGLSNPGFILTLLNPKLQGVDPHSPTLTEEQKLWIIKECELNYWYYLREVCRLPPNAGTRPVPFRASRGNIALSWMFLNSLDFILVQPRQTGKSVGVDCLMNWLLNIACTGTTISMITKDNGLRVSNVDRLKTIRDLMPGYLYTQSKKDANNQIALTNIFRDNVYNTNVAQSSVAGATNVGRGQTTAIFHVDEAPFCSHIGPMLQAALPATTAARQEAVDLNQPNGIIFTTTAGKKDDPNGSIMWEKVCESAPWTDEWFDLADRDELYKVVNSSCKGKYTRMVYAAFSHTQLGLSDDWLAAVLASTGSKGEDADRDYFNIWTSGSVQSPLSTELNNIINHSIKPALYNQISAQGYTLRWQKPQDEIDDYMANNHTVLSMDTSEAVGKDDIGITLSDVKTLETIAAADINETSTTTFGIYIAGLLIKYPKMTLIFERKSTGLAIFDVISMELIRNGVDPFRRVFNNIVQEKNERKEEYQNISTGKVDMSLVTKYRRHFGFMTTAASRNFLFSNTLPQNAKMAGSKVYDFKLAGQITGLVQKNGRIDHVAGGHDDMVIAWLLAGWMLSNGLNLDYYGLTPIECLSQTGNIKIDTVEDFLQHKRAKDFRERIEAITEELMRSHDISKVMALEGELRRLVDKSRNYLPELLSIDGLLEQTRRERKLNAATARRRRYAA